MRVTPRCSARSVTSRQKARQRIVGSVPMRSAAFGTDSRSSEVPSAAVGSGGVA